MLTDFLPDVTVRTANVPGFIDDALSIGVLWKAVPGRFLIEVPEVARYLVEAGNRVTIEPFPSVNDLDVLRFFRMTPLAALLFQRGILAFHAAAVVGAQGAVLIAGDSGAGKSTLLSVMLQRGYDLLTDDIAAVDLNEQGLPMVFPIVPEMVLWPDAMEKIKMKTNGQKRHVIPMEERFVSSPQPLKAIYRLLVHKDRIELSTVEGMKMFNTLTDLIYNSRIADVLLDRTVYMRKAAVIARNIPLRILRRPRGCWCADELADIVERECR